MIELTALEAYVHAGICVLLFGVGFIAGQQR